MGGSEIPNRATSSAHSKKRRAGFGSVGEQEFLCRVGVVARPNKPVSSALKSALIFFFNKK